MKTVPDRPTQLPLDLAHRPAFGAEDFFLSSSNDLAVKLIDDWPAWGQYGQLLIGPAASGKSHLVNVWRLRSNARVFRARDLDADVLPDLAREEAICIEDIDRGPVSEEALFHLLNRVKEQGGHVLLTARASVNELDIELRDLRSRLLALPGICINSPDDQLLKAVMIKQFADRQIEVDPSLVEYLFKRMERSMKAVAEMVEKLDRGALGAGRAITRPLAREILMEDERSSPAGED